MPTATLTRPATKETNSSQPNLNVSFPKNEVEVLIEMKRVAYLTHTPIAMLTRNFIREGLKNLPNEVKLMCGYS